MRSRTLFAATFVAIVTAPALAQTVQCGLDEGVACSATASGATAASSPPASLAGAVAAADPQVQAELMRTLAMVEQAATAAAQAAEQAQADIAGIEAEVTFIQARAAQGQREAAVPTSLGAVAGSPQ
jgi:hypothetical protein